MLIQNNILLRRKIFINLFNVIVFFFSLQAFAQQPSGNCCEDFDMLTKFTSLEDALAARDNVTYLDLSLQPQKLTAIPKEVALLPNLECLNVSFNRISVIPADIKNLTKLRCIDLSGNQYLQQLPDFLKDMPSLKVILIEDLKTWSDVKKQEVTRKFPGIEIRY